MKSEQLQLEIDIIDKIIQPHILRREQLEEELRNAVSIETIEKYKITKDMVQFSDEANLPYFGHISEFAKFLKNCNKPYCEWNGIIYKTDEIIGGFMKSNPSMREEHLK